MDGAEQRDLERRRLDYLPEAPHEIVLGLPRFPKGTLKTWMHRARNQLRKIVEKKPGGYGRS